jgi:hypothetical protein
MSIENTLKALRRLHTDAEKVSEALAKFVRATAGVDAELHAILHRMDGAIRDLRLAIVNTPAPRHYSSNK